MYAVASHGLLNGAACERLAGGLFKEVVITDSIPLPAHKNFQQLTVLSVADLLGETIKRMHAGSSVELAANGNVAVSGKRRARARLCE